MLEHERQRRNDKAADLIEDVLNDRLVDLADFQVRVAALKLSDKQEAATIEIHQAAHFLTDADIRARDSDYDAQLRSSLRQAVARLRRMEGR